MLDLDTRVCSKDSMASLERQMQIAGHTMAHVHVTLQGQVGAYNQEWQGAPNADWRCVRAGCHWLVYTHCHELTVICVFDRRLVTSGLQTQCRQLDIERAILEKDYHAARNDTSIMDGYCPIRFWTTAEVHILHMDMCRTTFICAGWMRSGPRLNLSMHSLKHKQTKRNEIRNKEMLELE